MDGSTRAGAASAWLAGRNGGKASTAATGGGSLVEAVNLLAEEVLPQLGLEPIHKTVRSSPSLSI